MADRPTEDRAYGAHNIAPPLSKLPAAYAGVSLWMVLWTQLAVSAYWADQALPFIDTIRYATTTVSCPMSMSQQVTAVCRSCFYQLCQLKSVKSSLTRQAIHSFIQAFVHCRPDYCNSALAAVATVYLQKLKSV